METVLQRSRVLKIAAIDAVLMTVAIMLPIVAHSLGLGLRYCEPMRLALITTILFVPERKNAFMMALILPWLSFAIMGMPMPWKASIMSVELMFNVFLFYRLTDLRLNAGISMLTSILLAKMLYYILKYMTICVTLVPQMPVMQNIPATLMSTIMLTSLFYVGLIFTKK